MQWSQPLVRRNHGESSSQATLSIVTAHNGDDQAQWPTPDAVCGLSPKWPYQRGFDDLERPIISEIHFRTQVTDHACRGQEPGRKVSENRQNRPGLEKSTEFHRWDGPVFEVSLVAIGSCDLSCYLRQATTVRSHGDSPDQSAHVSAGAD